MTYYIDWEAGSDANNGTAKATPWKHHPEMNGWSGSYSHVAGDQFIFKGGVTWPNSALSLYIEYDGTSVARDYYGVDFTWFNSLSIGAFTADAATDVITLTGHGLTYGKKVRLVSSGTLPGGLAADTDYYVRDVTANTFKLAPTLPDYAPIDITSTGSGTHNIGWTQPVLDAGGTAIVDARATRNNIIFLKGDYVTIDNLELKGQLIVSTALSYGNAVTTWAANFPILKNLYAHDWVIGTAGGADYGGLVKVNGGTSVTAEGCVIKGPETIDPAYVTDPSGLDSGVGVFGFSVVTGCDISRTTQGIFTVGTASYNHIHNACNSFDSAAHENAIWMTNGATCFNNVLHDITEGTCIYSIAGWTGSGVSTQKIYNNVIWNSGPAPITISDQGTATEAATTSALVYNNTLVKSNGIVFLVADRPADPPIDTIDIRNNLYICDVTPTQILGTIPALTNSNNVTMSVATATANGLVAATFYKPLSEIAALVEQGANISTVFSTDIEGVERPAAPNAWDIGAYQWSEEEPPTPPAAEPKINRNFSSARRFAGGARRR